jgi:hypothetical protein
MAPARPHVKRNDSATALSQWLANAFAFVQIASASFHMAQMLSQTPGHLKMPRPDAYARSITSRLSTESRHRSEFARSLLVAMSSGVNGVNVETPHLVMRARPLQRNARLQHHFELDLDAIH